MYLYAQCEIAAKIKNLSVNCCCFSRVRSGSLTVLENRQAKQSAKAANIFYKKYAVLTIDINYK